MGPRTFKRQLVCSYPDIVIISQKKNSRSSPKSCAKLRGTSREVTKSEHPACCYKRQGGKWASHKLQRLKTASAFTPCGKNLAGLDL